MEDPKETHIKNWLDKPAYSNYRFYHSDGQTLMFIGSEKLANWYKRKNLVQEIDGSPRSLQFLFEPKGFGNHERKYGLGEMPNMCVSCGTEDRLTKHHVVPYCYRKHLPDNMKSRNHHDVVLMCRDCHSEYENHAGRLKKALDPGVSPERLSDYKALIHKRKIRHCALSIVNAMKSNRTDAKFWNTANGQLAKLEEMHGGKLTWDQIEAYAEMYVPEINLDLEHPQRVFSAWQGTLYDFCVMWRSHFIEVVQPRYMPEGWSVDYNFD